MSKPALLRFKSSVSKVKVTNILADTPGSKYVHADAAMGPAEKFWSLRYNLCTHFGMQETLTPITRSVAHEVHGLTLDEFGNPHRKKSDEEEAVAGTCAIQLDADQAYNLT